MAIALETSASRVSAYERGLNPVTTDHIEAIARALGVTPEYICGVSGPSPSTEVSDRERALLDAVRRRSLADSLALVSSFAQDWHARRL